MKSFTRAFICFAAECRIVQAELSDRGSLFGEGSSTSAVTGQRSDQLSYVPRLFFNNLVIRHIESSASQLSLFSLFSIISLLWTQFWASVDTTWTPNWTPNQPTQQRSSVYQMTRGFGVQTPGHRVKTTPGLGAGTFLRLVSDLT